MTGTHMHKLFAPIALSALLSIPVAASATPMSDREEIAARVGSFAWRDQARWVDLRSSFTDDATIHVSWYSGSIDGFIDASKKLTEAGDASTKHWQSAPRIVVCGNRAVAENDAAIMVRTKVGPVELDVTSYARFFDRLERDDRHGWRIRSRTAIYEKDRADSVGPSFIFWLGYLLTSNKQYPPQLKHLAAGLASKGIPLMADVVTSGSDKETRLKSQAWEWSQCAQQVGARLP